MADSSKDKFKYTLLKGIDFSSFTVFDPVVRLAFGEDPKRQIKDIGKYLVTPILFVLLCFFIWSTMAPRHKTKSGEVPGPMTVLEAGKDSARFSSREHEKANDFALTGSAREARITEVEKTIAGLEAELAEKQKISTRVEEEVKAATQARMAPLQEKLDSINARSKEEAAVRKEALATLSEEVAAGTKTPQALIDLVREDGEAKDAARESTKKLKADIDEIRSNPPKRLNEARLAANKVADELQHQKKRIDFLTKGNRSLKVADAEEKAEASAAAVATAETAGDALKKARATVKNEKAAARAEEQKYAPAATVFWQARRSIFTVIIGFLLACAIAIPVGMLCGLNRVFMACMTPLISIFRPVSPVVWLLIFQIVVGAFFLPTPEDHALFKFFNASWNPLEFLQVNPAMVFSACTVAMCAMWPALVNTALGVSSVDRDHLNVAKVLRLGFWSRLFKIIIPSSLPLVFAGLRISLGVGWMVLIAAEALSSSDGLGKFVWDEYQNGSSQSFANIILACFMVGIIGFFLDRIMIILQKLVTFDDGSATV